MSTVRIQIRRGLASEWTSVDPVLAAGELGLESDTNLMKFGNGTDNWSDLAYANVTQSSFSNTIADYVPLTDVGQPNGVASLDSAGKIPAGQLNITELAQDALSSALVAGTNVDIAYDDPAGQITIGVTDSVVLSGALDVTGTSTLEDLIVNGDLTVNGTTTTVNTANFTTSDPLLYIGEDNPANSVDLGIVASFNDGTYQHAGLVRDASDGVWKLFSGVVSEPGATVDFTTHTKDSLEIGSLSATNASIGNVNNTEIQYLNGVTSGIQSQFDGKQDKVSGVTDSDIGQLTGVTGNIQTQINNKLSSATASSTYAPLNSPNFSGTVVGVTKAMVGLGNVDNTADADKPVSTDVQNELDLKANLSSPTFDGTVVLPATTSIGTVTSTELGYLDGVTSGIQTQIGTVTTNLTNHSNATTSVHGIADTSQLALKSEISALTKSSVGLGNVDNTSDANKPVSTAQATAIATAKSEAIAEVTAVIDGAPSALNTLNELAAALGDDANFASTVTTSLASKVPSITPIISKTASYTLSDLAERDSMIEVNSSSATTITIPTNASVAFPVGASIDISQISTGQVTIAGAGGVTVNATPGLKLRTQWSTVTLFKRGTDSWIVYGDLTA
jgi:hypothetical protein